MGPRARTRTRPPTREAGSGWKHGTAPSPAPAATRRPTEIRAVSTASCALKQALTTSSGHRSSSHTSNHPFEINYAMYACQRMSLGIGYKAVPSFPSLGPPPPGAPLRTPFVETTWGVYDDQAGRTEFGAEKPRGSARGAEHTGAGRSRGGDGWSLGTLATRRHVCGRR